MGQPRSINLQDVVATLSDEPPERWEALLGDHGLSEALRTEVMARLRALSGVPPGEGLLEQTVDDVDVPRLADVPEALDRRDAIAALNCFFDDVARTGPRYHLLEELGRGGYGVVYKAQQRTPVKRSVALKLIRPGFDTAEVIARFNSERQALARMDHPNIAKVLDAGADDHGRPYFVMEYVPGVPITAYADENKLSIRQRLELFIQVCDAIAHAHTKAIIHRDIKASNVLAYTADGRPAVKVIDFGIAKALTGDRLTDLTYNTAHGEAIGTYESMSPEQAEGSPDIDGRTDVYSLGVLLYELLAGGKPFDADTLCRAAEHEKRRIIREVDPPRPSTRLRSLGASATRVAAARQLEPNALARQLQSELEWIPLKAMRKERDGRYRDPLALAADLRNYLEGRTLRAGPLTVRYRVRKFVRRNRVAVAVTSALVVAVAAVVVTLMLTVWMPARQVAEQIEEARSAANPWIRLHRADQLAREMEKKNDPRGLGLVDEVRQEVIGKLDRRVYLNSVGMRFVEVRPGPFVMGSPESALYYSSKERQVRVTLSKGYYLQATEVTRAQWQQVMGELPYYRKANEYPMGSVSWIEAEKFCRKLSESEKLKGHIYRLPTEAEWEYAARAGTTTNWQTPTQEEAIEMAWVNTVSTALLTEKEGGPLPVASLRPNGWGFFDMCGNMHEFCADVYTDTRPTGPLTDPTGPAPGALPTGATQHPIKGGCWGLGAHLARPAARVAYLATRQDPYTGFRVLLELPPVK